MMRDRTLSLQSEFQYKVNLHKLEPSQIYNWRTKVKTWKKLHENKLPYTAAHSQPNNTGSLTRRWAQMAQTRLITWKYKSDHDTKYLVLQTEFKYINNLQPNFTIDTTKVQI